MPAPVRTSSLVHRDVVRPHTRHVPQVPPSEGEQNLSTPKKKKDIARKRKPLVSLASEIIEISSDDDSPSPSIPNPMVTDLRRQVGKLTEVV
jgi:hypothetical protein